MGRVERSRYCATQYYRGGVANAAGRPIATAGPSRLTSDTFGARAVSNGASRGATCKNESRRFRSPIHFANTSPGHAHDRMSRACTTAVAPNATRHPGPIPDLLLNRPRLDQPGFHVGVDEVPVDRVDHDVTCKKKRRASTDSTPRCPGRGWRGCVCASRCARWRRQRKAHTAAMGSVRRAESPVGLRVHGCVRAWSKCVCVRVCAFV